MKLGFFTDPHLGLERGEHTTPASRAALRKKLFDQAKRAVGIMDEQKCKFKYCLGDLVDKYSNSEEIISQAYQIANELDCTLSGNHDEKNIAGSFGTLRLLKKHWLSNQIIAADNINEPYVYTQKLSDFGSAGYVDFIPHVMSQALFEASLDEAIKRAKDHNGNGVRLLLLHCNVGEPGFKEIEREGTSLYLTDEYNAKVADIYDFILVGHEHPPKTFGNTHILGNTFPLSFGEIADRFVTIIDTDTRTLERVKIFDAEVETREIVASDLVAVGGDMRMTDETLMVSIGGVIDQSELSALSKALKKFWLTNPQLLMVKNGSEIVRASKAQRDDTSDFMPKTLPEIVGQSVEGTPYAEAYKEAAEAVRAKT